MSGKRLAGKLLRLMFLLTLVLGQMPLAAQGGRAEGGANAVADEPQFTNQELFVAGKEGYNTFRIPTILATRSGEVAGLRRRTEEQSLRHGEHRSGAEAQLRRRPHMATAADRVRCRA
ncbi:glycoside hydrolase [Paenibacillus sp. P26]|nr:glycoside hydrolase [Paenibacillus sp. P26]